MNGSEFYEKHNIGRATFARVCSTGVDSLDKYWDGKPMRDRTRSKIEYAVRYFEENDVDWGRLTGMDRFYRPDYVDRVKWNRRSIVYELGLGGTV